MLERFEVQNVKFAIPFAAYRASIGDFSELISDKPGTALPRRILATTIYSMHLLQDMAAYAARMIVYGQTFGCVLTEHVF